jgi:hypothetical protein
MATEVEKIVVTTDSLQAQEFLPQIGDGLFQFTPWRLE